MFHRVSTGDTNAVNVKATAGTVYGWSVGNVNGAVRYVKLFDKATSAPVPGSDTVALTIEVPGNTNGSGNNFCFTPGIKFANGIGLAAVTGAADSDNTGVGVNDLQINLYYL